MNLATVATLPIGSTTDSPVAMQTLLASNVDQQQARVPCQRAADRCVVRWNAVHAAIGSFSDEHSTL